MTESTNSSGLLTHRGLGVVYVAGIALNVVAFAVAASAGEWLVAGTVVVVIAYLCVRLWMIVSS